MFFLFGTMPHAWYRRLCGHALHLMDLLIDFTPELLVDVYSCENIMPCCNAETKGMLLEQLNYFGRASSTCIPRRAITWGAESIP